MSWATIVAIPLGGYLATRYRIPNVVMIGGLAVSIVLGAALPFAPYPIVFFTLLGLAFASSRCRSSAPSPQRCSIRACAGPASASIFLWYFGGMPVLIFSAGLLRDWTGSLTATLLYADIMLLCTLLLAIYFRMTQGNRAVRS